MNKALRARRHVFNIRDAKGMSPDTVKKDLWGMGYPYHIHYYAGEVLAVSSDYGVLLFKLNL